MKISELREHQVKFEKIRVDLKSEFKEINNLRKSFVNDYPVEKILKLDIDKYIIRLLA